MTTAHQLRACQFPTQNPLDGCPSNTVLVGPEEYFKTVQSAVLSIPHDNVTYTILILPGNYTEQVNVTRSGPLTLIGQSALPTNASANVVNILWSSATGNAENSFDNAFTSTLTVAPTLNASLTGSGPTGNNVPMGTPFGNQDFRVYNVNFINDYLPYSAGPSLALSISYANAGFYFSQFLSYQDTVYIGKLGNAYMYSCIIGGQTDFFYGFGTLWVENSHIELRGCGGGITAWKGMNTTFPNKYGVYIHKTYVAKANSSLQIEQKCALGRPWNAQMRAIFAQTYLDDSIRPSGYIDWSTTDPRVNRNTTTAEFENYGPGFNVTGRRAASNVTIEMTPRQYQPFSSPRKVFQYPSGDFDNTGWIDPSYLP
ncbi:carbohydrate esterase family 8 protein [Acrodontium crateriforme]|uniref:pectinesterase n=1 Tax=Acrodontium crateriforme TaxID=150365 RepID=A0AAQ3M313_9PEZI|nr:carbohydrate esterase family 8 protein [Acrodontium crateriforme]